MEEVLDFCFSLEGSFCEVVAFSGDDVASDSLSDDDDEEDEDDEEEEEEEEDEEEA